MTAEQKEIEQLREALEYEKRERYAAEMALYETHEVRRCERPGRFTPVDEEFDEWH